MLRSELWKGLLKNYGIDGNTVLVDVFWGFFWSLEVIFWVNC